MLSTGIKTPVGIKVSGPDLNVLQTLTQQIEQAMKTLPETLSAYGDRVVGGYFLDFDINREAAARYGLTVGDVQDVIQSAIGGMNITETVEGLERYPVNLRYPRDLRDNLDALKRVLVPTPTGSQIPLIQVADLTLRRGTDVIKSEGARPNAWVLYRHHNLRYRWLCQSGEKKHWQSASPCRRDTRFPGPASLSIWNARRSVCVSSCRLRCC